MVFITQLDRLGGLLGDRIAVDSALPGRSQEMIDVPFARPRDGNCCAPIALRRNCRAFWNAFQAPAARR